MIWSAIASFFIKLLQTFIGEKERTIETEKAGAASQEVKAMKNDLAKVQSAENASNVVRIADSDADRLRQSELTDPNNRDNAS